MIQLLLRSLHAVASRGVVIVRRAADAEIVDLRSKDRPAIIDHFINSGKQLPSLRDQQFIDRIIGIGYHFHPIYCAIEHKLPELLRDK